MHETELGMRLDIALFIGLGREKGMGLGMVLRMGPSM